MFYTSALPATSSQAVLPTHTSPLVPLPWTGQLPASTSLLREEDFFQSWVLNATCGVRVGDPVTRCLACLFPASPAVVTDLNIGPRLQDLPSRSTQVWEAGDPWQLLKQDQDTLSISKSAFKRVIGRTPSWAAVTYFRNMLGLGVGSQKQQQALDQSSFLTDTSAAGSAPSPTPECSWWMSGSDLMAHSSSRDRPEMPSRKAQRAGPCPCFTVCNAC